jgi:hypothetical protein
VFYPFFTQEQFQKKTGNIDGDCSCQDSPFVRLLLMVIIYFGPQIAQIYAEIRLEIRPAIRPAIFAEIRSSRIFKDYFLRVRNNETNKGRIDKKDKKDKKYKKCNLSVEFLFKFKKVFALKGQNNS